MPELPIIKAKELIKILKIFGFEENRQSGSHLIMKNSDGLRTTIPIYAGKDITKGTLKAILKDIEITAEQFIEALKTK